MQKGDVAQDPSRAAEVARGILASNPNADLVVKAQIHAGGRGKGYFKETGFKGGVKVVKSAEEVETMASEMLGKTLVTKQTGEAGQQCQNVLINEGVDIEAELYFALLMDRAANGPVVVASTQGGMDIEEVAEKSPDAIIKVPVDIKTGMTTEIAEDIAARLGFEGDLRADAGQQFRALYDLFIGTDATQVEINPLAVARISGVPNAKDQIISVDAKLNFDDNAAYRQKDIFAMRDTSMEDPRDVAAENAGLNYIGLDGNIGCMVNGAGLAMATMDIIKLHGAEPANFLDVGGGATVEQVTTAFKLLTSDSNVKALLVNVFGGVVRCDVISEGIVTAAKEVGLSIPLVVRLEGTNVEKGKAILQASGLDITTADDLDDAAKKAVAAV